MKRSLHTFILIISTIHLFSQISKDSALKIFHLIEKDYYNFNKNYQLLQNVLNASIQKKDTHLIILSYQKLGDVLWFNSIYGKAEDYYFKSLELIDSAKHPKEYAYALYSIGWIECVQKERIEKIHLLRTALNVSVLLKDTPNIAVIANSISGTYTNMYNKDTTKRYYIDSAINTLLYVINKLKNSTWRHKLSQLETNIAQEYYLKRDYLNAYKYINYALPNFNLKNNKKKYLTSVLLKSQILNKIGYTDSARYLIKKYHKDIEQINDNETLKELYLILYEFEKKNKNYRKALEYHEQYQFTSDKINEELLSVKYEEMETNKELFKKEQSILALQKQAEIQQIKSQQKTYILFVALIFIIVIVFFLSKSIKQNKQIKKLHLKVSQQKNILEQKNKDIIDSINYASRIQKALITSDEYITKHFISENYFETYFSLYIPKDIVSGDFYWANVNLLHPDNPHYLAVCDSTGHGVPGAFMSLLNINYLTESVQEKQIYYPNDILNYVRNKLIQNLTYDEQQKDGMDASLILFDNKYQQSLTIFYTLANQQILITRENTKPILLSADKIPVGLFHSYQNFNLHSFKLQKGDWLYLYTDGYKDQFGGKKGKRILHKRFIEILTQICHLNAEQQKSYLHNFFTEWKQQNEQTDDVTILGIKI